MMKRIYKQLIKFKKRNFDNINLDKSFIRLLIESSCIAFRINTQFTITHVVKDDFKIFGVKVEDVIGKQLTAIPFDTSTIGIIESAAKDILKGEISNYVGLLAHKHNNKETTLIVAMVPIFESVKQIIGIELVIKDYEEFIISQKDGCSRDEKNSLNGSQRFYEDFFENAPDMFLFYDDKNKKYINCNNTLVHMLGYTKREVLSLIPKTIFHPDSYKQLEHNIKSFKESEIINQEALVKKKNGTYMDVSLSVTAAYGQEGELIGDRIIMRDISELVIARKLAAEHQKKLEIINKDLQRRNKELDSFAHLVSHDLRAPLRSIGAFCFLAQKELDENTNSLLSLYLNKISTSVVRVNQLIEDILNYFCYKKDNRNAENIDVGAVIEDVISILGKPEKFTFKIQESMPHIFCPKVPLQQVFQNLINNAIKHHNKDNEGVIQIKAHERGKWVYFTVMDNGAGIPKDRHQKIFNMFQSFPSTNDMDGNGIGLALVKNIVESYGGSIHVFSQLEQGTRFEFTWPKSVMPADKDA